MATPESKVKANVVKQLKALGAYYFFPLSGGFGRRGVPDVVGCYKGRFFGIECKAGSNKPTALQTKNLQEIDASGGVSMVVNENNMLAVTAVLIACTKDKHDK